MLDLKNNKLGVPEGHEIGSEPHIDSTEESPEQAIDIASEIPGNLVDQENVRSEPNVETNISDVEEPSKSQTPEQILSSSEVVLDEDKERIEADLINDNKLDDVAEASEIVTKLEELS